MREAYDAETIEGGVVLWQAVFGSSFTAPATPTTVGMAAPTKQLIDSSLRIPLHLTNPASLIGMLRCADVARA